MTPDMAASNTFIMVLVIYGASIRYAKIPPIGSARPDRNEYQNAFFRLPVE